MLIVACTFAVWRCVTDEMTARREHAPTAIDMSRFAADYHGQQWLSLTGRLDAGHATSFAVGDADGWDVWVPLRAGDDPTGAEPVHALVEFGPVPRAEVHAYLGGLPQGTTTLTGAQVFFDAAKVGAGVAQADPVVMMQPGNTPSPPGMGLALAIFFGLILLLAVGLEVRSWLAHAGR